MTVFALLQVSQKEAIVSAISFLHLSPDLPRVLSPICARELIRLGRLESLSSLL